MPILRSILAGLAIVLALAPARAGSPGQAFRDCEDKDAEGRFVCPEMVTIPAGSFDMGSADGRKNEKPVHRVTIPEPLALGKYEVTVGEYLSCVDAGGCREPHWREPGSRYNLDTGSAKRYRKLGPSLTGDRHPIVGVDWDDAKAYVAWLSAKTHQQYRLPSEAEWEYAARAGTTTPYPWGERISHDNANYGTESCCNGLASGGDRWEHTSPVGSFAANGFGLHDMHGNVREWVEDCGNFENYNGAPGDGGAWTAGDACGNRIVRGGAWDSRPSLLRSAVRGRGDTFDRNNHIGFRLARTIP